MWDYCLHHAERITACIRTSWLLIRRTAWASVLVERKHALTACEKLTSSVPGWQRKNMVIRPNTFSSKTRFASWIRSRMAISVWMEQALHPSWAAKKSTQAHSFQGSKTKLDGGSGGPPKVRNELGRDFVCQFMLCSAETAQATRAASNATKTKLCRGVAP